MNDSHKRYFTFFSWFSLAAPFIAYGLCFMVYSPPCLYIWRILPEDRYNLEVLTRCYGFLVAGVVGGFVLFADIGFKRWLLVWLPVVGLAFGFWLFVQASWFTYILASTL